MAGIVKEVQKQNLHDADEVRMTDKGRVELVRLSGTTVGRVTLQPRWRWSEDVKPVVGTETCEVKHLAYIVSGRLRVRMNDGEELLLEPGDLASVAPGHEAWVEGDEAVVMLELAGGEVLAKGATTEMKRAA
jgi:quercetin dioxygenase-like cupin family protein